jgi:elongation factor G
MEQVKGGDTIITALVPLAEIQRYGTDLRSITQGRGIYEQKLSHYQSVPTHLAQNIMEAYKKEQEES